MPDIKPIDGELQFNGYAIAGSLILLVVLTGIAFERILGLDKLLANFLRSILAKRSAKNRQTLEDLFNDENDRGDDDS